MDARSQERSQGGGLTIRLAPLGVPVAVVADDALLLETVGEAYAEWRVEGPTPPPLVRLRLELGAETATDGEVDIRVQGSRLTLAGAGVAGHADGLSARAHCVVPRRLLGDPAALMTEVADTLLLYLLAHVDRTPLHAAGVVFGETLGILAGPSGSGKSTLALAAAGRGLQILSDDTLYIQLRPRARIWGLRRPLHVFPKDAPRFTGATRLRGGKLKTAIPLPPGSAAPWVAEEAEVVLLDRGERLDLARVDAEFARSRLARLDPGFDLFPRESAAAAQALTERGAWRLTLSRDPEAAIDFLRERLSVRSPAS